MAVFSMGLDAATGNTNIVHGGSTYVYSTAGHPEYTKSH